jgi:hypothetical protein
MGRVEALVVAREIGKPTKRGFIALGELIRARLKETGMLQKDLAAELTRRGRPTNEDEITKFLNARVEKPDGSIMVAISRIRLLPHPAKAGEFYTTDDLFDICAELIDPATGQCKEDVNNLV